MRDDPGRYLPLPESLTPPRQGMNVEMEVLVNGRALTTRYHEGRTYLLVPRLGTEFEVVIRNHGANRIKALLTIDGLSAITALPATELDAGYVVDPFSTLRLNGWRRNLGTVSAFRFEEREYTVAYAIGRPEDIGVIRLLAIEELWGHTEPMVEPKDQVLSDPPRPAGTAYGRDVDSFGYWVPFLRSTERQIITLHYNSVDELRRGGVPVEGWLPSAWDIFQSPPPGHPAMKAWPL